MTSTSSEYQNEIIGIFRSPQQLDAAIGDLCSAGWDRAELSLLGQKEHLAPAHTAGEVAVDPKAPRSAVVSETDSRQERTLAGGMAGVVAGFLASGAIVATGGTALAAVIGAAAAGGGGAIAGDFIGRVLSKKMAEPMEDQIARGGIVLWALLRKPEQETRARDILLKHGAVDVHIQEHATH